MTVGLGHYLAVAAILFTLGILGIFINRKNVIVILMSIELILLAVNINLVAFSTHLGDLVGQVFALLVLTVAAAEAAIGLAILVAELVMAGSVWVMKPTLAAAKAHATPAGVTNTEALGRILYTDYAYYFQIAGLVLLVAMIGAIVLTLRARPGVRRQVISVQNARTAAMAVDMVEIKPGEGA